MKDLIKLIIESFSQFIDPIFRLLFGSCRKSRRQVNQNSKIAIKDSLLFDDNPQSWTFFNDIQIKCGEKVFVPSNIYKRSYLVLGTPALKKPRQYPKSNIIFGKTI